jgi:hypothetical protein
LETSEQLQMNQSQALELCPAPLPSFRQASHANLTALREKVLAIVTSATCGTKLQDVSELLSRAGLSAKIRPVYSQGKISGISQEWQRAWPRQGLLLHGECGELVTSERLTSEIESLLSPIGTPTAAMTVRSKNYRKGRTPNPAELAEMEIFPTPLSSDAIRTRYSEESLKKVYDKRTNGEYKLAGVNLAEYVAGRPTKGYPTPQAKSWGCSGARKKLADLQAAGEITDEEYRKMTAGNGGKLNPTWVELLMGFPVGWTEIEV